MADAHVALHGFGPRRHKYWIKQADKKAWLGNSLLARLLFLIAQTRRFYDRVILLGPSNKGREWGQHGMTKVG